MTLFWTYFEFFTVVVLRIFTRLSDARKSVDGSSSKRGVLLRKALQMDVNYVT